MILSLDQGTTSSRAIIFSADGLPIASAQEEFKQLFPKPGWVEHDATEIWQTQLKVAREAISKAGLTGSQIKAIGITNQRETVVVWDRTTGEPVGNAIVWQDRRTSDFCRDLKKDGHTNTIQEITGLVIDPYFSGTKLRWLIQNRPGVGERVKNGELAFGTIDSWLIWNLTGGQSHITDATNASRTQLCAINEVVWSKDMLELFEIPSDVLPNIVPSSGVVAESASEIFGKPIPIAGVAGDQHAALFGQACH
ncbi:MAG: FGGY family carbohydrate kinase, partial [Verrucomicrobiota bacterium]